MYALNPSGGNIKKCHLSPRQWGHPMQVLGQDVRVHPVLRDGAHPLEALERRIPLLVLAQQRFLPRMRQAEGVLRWCPLGQKTAPWRPVRKDLGYAAVSAQPPRRRAFRGVGEALRARVLRGELQDLLKE